VCTPRHFKSDGHSHAVPRLPGRSGFFVVPIDDFTLLTFERFAERLAQAVHYPGAALGSCRLEMT
jgi:hypothetical protein